MVQCKEQEVSVEANQTELFLHFLTLNYITRIGIVNGILFDNESETQKYAVRRQVNKIQFSGLFSLARKWLNQIYNQVESCGPYNRSTQLSL